MKGAQKGDSVSISGLKVWDLESPEKQKIQRQLAINDLIKKRNELHPDIQEMLEGFTDRSQDAVSGLMQTILDEVNRDRQTKHNEFVELHKQINTALETKGPVTKNDITTLLNSVQEVQELATRANELMRTAANSVDSKAAKDHFKAISRANTVIEQRL